MTITIILVLIVALSVFIYLFTQKNGKLKITLNELGEIAIELETLKTKNEGLNSLVKTKDEQIDRQEKIIKEKEHSIVVQKNEIEKLDGDIQGLNAEVQNQISKYTNCLSEKNKMQKELEESIEIVSTVNEKLTVEIMNLQNEKIKLLEDFDKLDKIHDIYIKRYGIWLDPIEDELPQCPQEQTAIKCSSKNKNKRKK